MACVFLVYTKPRNIGELRKLLGQNPETISLYLHAMVEEGLAVRELEPRPEGQKGRRVHRYRWIDRDPPNLTT